MSDEHQRIAWKHEKHVNFYLSESLPFDEFPQLLSEIKEAIKVWNNALGYEFIILKNENVLYKLYDKKDGYNVITFSNELNFPVQALTRVKYSGSTIIETDIVLNSSLFYHVDNALPIVGIDMRSLLIHELGHVLGLNHIDRHESVMYYALGWGDNRRSLSSIDIESLLCEY